MSTQIKRVIMFAFASTQGEVTFNFNIPAETQTEACDKLLKMLGAIQEEVTASRKVGVN
jgi:hypothetical protein